MLFDEIVPSIQLVADDARMRVGKKFAMPKKPGKIDRLRIELPRLLTALDSAPASALSSILALLRALKAWLADQRANPDVDSIRAPFAQLLTAVYSRIVPSESLSPAMQAKFMELRGSLFVLVAEWEDTFPSTAADALAALLRGPVPARSPAATAVSQAFDRDRALKWINGMLSRSGHGNGGGSAMASTAAAANYGFKGLVHLLEGNPSSKNLYESIARKCFALPPREPLSRYYLCAFSVVFQGAIQHQDWSVTAIETVLLLGLIKLADEKHDVDTLAITASPLPLTVALPSSQLQAASSAVPMPPHSASTPGTEFPSPTLGPMRNRLDSGTTGAGGGGLVPSLFSCNASQSALDMLQCLQDRLFLDLDVAGVAPLIGLPIHSHSAAVVLVERMARNHPDWTLRLLSELFYRIEPSAHSVQDLLFNFAAVLVRNVVLLREDGTLSVDTRFVIENLLYLTMSLSDGHSAAIKQCWINLAAASEHNLRAVVAYSVQLAKKTRSDTAVSFLRVILTFVHDVDTTFVHLLPYLTPPMFIYFSPDPDGPLASTYYVPSLDTVIPTNPTRHQWSEGIIGTLFVSGIVRYLPADTIEQYLALFLEVAIAQLDHPDAFVASEMRAFLCTLFQFEFTSFARLHQFLDEVVASLPVALVDAWNAISLRWASNCTILHVAIKSLQMFRCSLRIVTQDMLRDLLRLYVTVAGSPTPTSAQFATEILTSIRAVLSHPTFHGSVDMVTQFLQIILQALVQPPEEHVDMLLQVLEIIIVADSRRVSLVDLGYIVPHVSVTGLFLAVLQRSNNRRACTLMNALLTISEPRLTWKPVAILLANLTDMAKLSPPQSAPSAGAPPTSSAAIDAVMSQLAIITGAPAGRPLGKYLSVWVKYRAKTADDLMHQLAVALRDPYLSQYADPILQTLLGFLSGPDRDVSVMDTLLTLIPTISVAAKSHQAVLPSRTTTINKKTRAGSELVREWARLSAMDAAARASDTAASAAAAASAEKSSPTGSAGPSPGSGSGGRGNGSGGGKAGTSPQHGVDGGKPLYRLPTLPSASSSMSRDGEHQSHDALQPSNLELATSTASVASGPLMSSASSSSSPRDHSAVSRSATASARALPSAVPEEFPSLSRGTSAGSTAPLGQYHHQQLQHHHHQYAADEGSAMSMPTLSTDPLATAAGTPGDGSLGQVALLNGSAAMLDTMTSGASSPRGVGTAGSGGRRGATPSSSRVNSGPSPDVARRLSGQTWAPTSAYALYESGHHAPTRIPPTTPSTAAPLSPLVPLDQIPSASGESLIAGTVPGSELDLVSATPPTMLPMSMSSESLLFSAPLAASYHAAASAAFGGGGAGGSNGGLYSSPRTLGLAAGTSGTVSSRDRATSLNNLMLVGTGRVSLIPNAPAAVTITSALDDDDDDDDEDGHGKGTSFAQGSSSGQFNPTDDDAYDSDRSEVSMSSAHRSHSAGGGGGDEIDGDRSGPAVTTFGSTGSLDFMSQPVDFQQQEQHQDQALRQYKSTFSNGLHAAPLPPTSQLEGEDGGSLGSLLAAGSMTQLNGGAALSSFPLDSISSVETRGGSEALPLQLEIVPATTASLVSLTSVESLAGVDAESLEPAPPVHLGRRRG
ncbi:hypothetical protein BC828DRAFT_215972 [Blastocladiella britannica]|nr:hypothetical protein BC828DRAFT_215972 [Blastocladiella britannica]